MTWIAWRQQRALFITVAVGLVLGVTAVLVLRAMMTADINSLGIADCLQDGPQSRGVCSGEPVGRFESAWFDRMRTGQVLVLALPALVGVFVGAPLFAREFEQGTHALAFTQSVSRTRWTVTKLLVTAVPVLAAVVVMQFVVKYWLEAAGALGPLKMGQFIVTTFDSAGVSPVAYALFACTAGMFAGALFRRTLVGMTLVLAVFVVVRFVVNGFRLSLATPRRITLDDPFEQVSPRDGVTVNSGLLNPKGEELPATTYIDCGTQEATSCYHAKGLVSFRDIIPTDAARSLHLAEAAIFVALSVLFVAGTVWAVRRQV